MQPSVPSFRVAVIGGGPAGLMAAQTLAEGGASVDVYDAMASVGRKFLLAGRGGMNITHAEPYAEFVGRYAGVAGGVFGALPLNVGEVADDRRLVESTR